MKPRFQFSLSRMFAATTCLALAGACFRYLFVEPRLFGLMALLAAAALTIGAAAVLAKGKNGLIMALVICGVSFGLCLFVYLLFYTLFFEIPQDIRRERGRRRVITMQWAVEKKGTFWFIEKTRMSPFCIPGGFRIGS